MSHSTVSVTTYSDTFIPNFTCNLMQNGIVRIQINNICHNKANKDMMVRSKYKSKTKEELSCTAEIDRNQINENGELFIKYPMNFDEYNVEIKMKLKSSLMDWKNDKLTKCIVDIPSYLSFPNYKLNEKIRFHDEYTIKMMDGIIIKILSDHRYLIKYNNNKEIILPISRIYAFPINKQYLIHWDSILNSNIYKNDYIKRYNESEYKLIYIQRYNDREYKDIVLSLWKYFESERIYGDALKTYLFDYKKYHNNILYIESLENFLVKNICDFIFEHQYHYHFHCMVHGEHGRLKFSTMRKQYVENKDKSNKINMFWCDVCGAKLNEFNFVFSCKLMHQICSVCVNDKIESNLELKSLLYSIIHDRLNSFCIKHIAEYVIGKATCRPNIY